MENDLQICVGPKRTIKPEQSANHYKFSANVFLFIRFGSFLANEFQDCSNIRTFLNILYVQAGHVWLHADFVRMLIKGRVWNEKKKPLQTKITNRNIWRKMTPTSTSNLKSLIQKECFANLTLPCIVWSTPLSFFATA